MRAYYFYKLFRFRDSILFEAFFELQLSTDELSSLSHRVCVILTKIMPINGFKYLFLLFEKLYTYNIQYENDTI